MDISKLPFNRSLGINIDGNNVRLVPKTEHLNHVETVQAGVIYGIAEAAAGNCLVRRFSDLLDSHVAVLRSSTSKYRRPAVLGADIIGEATSDDNNAETFASRLKQRGRATIEIQVSLSQGESEVFRGSYVFFATKTN